MPEEMFSSAHRVTLRDLSKENLREILKLQVTEAQSKYVAPNAVSVAQAHYADNAWFKGIYVEGQPVGFVLLDDDAEAQNYFLWRFMIDSRYQGKGYGRDALSFVVEYVKGRPGAKTLVTSCVPGGGGPELFYQKCGFVDTGAFEEDEKVYQLTWTEEDEVTK